MRKVVLFIVSALALFGWQHSNAQTFPSKPIRLIVPYPPGGSPDVLARSLGQKISESVGQQVIVDNRPGGGGLTSIH
jgi:tripartite-type tricarboxylate transporter receptor subunit TctC